MSNAIISVFDKFSICFVPFIIIPFLEIAPIQEKNDNGIEITKLHGQDATKKNKAISIHLSISAPNINGTITNKIAITITIGVYTLENLVINFSVFPLLFVASYTKSIICEAIESLYSFSALI